MITPQIPEKRKALYYTGMALAALGALCFFSVFITGALQFGDFSHWEAKVRSEALRGMGGMGLLLLGFILMMVGRMGLAGSGIKLDPEQARQEIEPWSKMAGQLTNDALSEVEVVKRLTEHLGHEPAPAAPQPVKVRCRGCQALNDETDRFCGQCGQPL